MELKFGDKTAAPQIRGAASLEKAKDYSLGICGAMQHTRSCNEEFYFWYLVPLDDFSDEHLKLRDDGLFIPGDHEDDLHRELTRRFPSDIPNTSRLYPHEHTFSSRNNGKYVQYSRRGWLVLPHPWLDASDIDEVLEATRDRKAVLLDKLRAERLVGTYNKDDIEDAWRQKGFTIAYRTYHDIEFFRLNFNPQAAGRRPYYKAKTAYLRRISGEFTPPMLHTLFSYVCLNNWKSNKWSSVVGDVELFRPYTGGRLSFNVEDVLRAIELNRKLHKNPSWRNTNIYASLGDKSVHNWKDLLAELLQRVHGCESQSRREIEKIEAGLRYQYEQFLNGDWVSWYENLYINPETPLPTFEEYKAEKTYMYSHKLEHPQNVLKLCRWLRNEAKVAGIKMPPKPVKPLTPAQLRKRKARKGKRKRTCRKSSKSK